MRSEGQRRLLAVKGTLTAIAAEVGCKSSQAISDWRNGVKTPIGPMRARLFAAYGIPVRAWSLRPGTPLESDSVVAVPESALLESDIATPSTLDDCLALLSTIRRDRNQPDLMPSERVKLAAAEARILKLRSSLEQAAEFAESRYVASHPSWLRLRRALVDALEPHPIAAQAVLDAIATLENSSSDSNGSGNGRGRAR